MGNRRRSTITVTKVAVACAAATTVFAMAASGIVFVSGGRNYAEGLHQFALLVMLIAYVFLILSLLLSKKNQPVAMNVVEKDDCLVVSPCSTNAYVVLAQADIDHIAVDPHKEVSRDRRGAIRIIIARDVSIQEPFLNALALFPNLCILDLQDSIVSPEFWTALDELPNLSHVLATNAIADELLRNISFSLPEVKFWIGKRRNLVIASAAALHPRGVLK
jgi:hypothetical protein